MPKFFDSLVFKISLAILILETIVLVALGYYYVDRFSREIESRVESDAQIPGTLMDERALGHDAVHDLATLARLVGEDVIEAGVVELDGKVFFASDPEKESDDAAMAYGDAIAGEMRRTMESAYLHQEHREGNAHLVSISPLRSQGRLIGYLYLKVDMSRSQAQKRNIVRLFALGSVLCILLTTLAEVLIVHRLVSPRIRATVRCLEAVAEGDLGARVAGADSPDEVGVLQRSVNAMVSEIEVRATEIRDVNRQLAGEVEERKRSEEAAKRSEQRFRDLVQMLPEIVFEATADGLLTFVNRRGMEITGYTRTDMERGLTAFDLLDPQEHERARANLVKVLKGELTGGREYPLRRKDGSSFPAVVFSAPLIREGKPVGLRGLIVDVTEQKKLEERLRQAAKMEAVGTLAGGVAHDFNNILQAISGYTELLLQGSPETGVNPRHLEQIDRAADRAAELVRSLLAFSRKDRPSLQPLDLNQEVAQTVELLERTIPKMVEIETRLGGGLHQVRADPSQLSQVVMNLGANARDAMPDGGRLLIETSNVTLGDEYCDAHPEARPGEYVLLSVSDTGEGIAEGTVRHIFDPFFTTKDVGSGTGLGLSTVYGVVKGHGGHVSCDSRPGAGTRFDIHLPALVEEEKLEGRGETRAGTAEGGSERMLLVDDEESVLKLGQAVLKHYGYEVTTARSGEEALEIYRERGDSVDLVILDLGMPGMGGERCLQKLLELDPAVRVLVASGYSVDSQADEVLRAGARAFVSKPYHLDELARRVRQVLDE